VQTYHLSVYVEGELENNLDWVMAFQEMKSVIDPIVKYINHKLVNNLSGLENLTYEIISVWLFNKIKPIVPLLTKIEIHETPTPQAVFEGK